MFYIMQKNLSFYSDISLLNTLIRHWFKPYVFSANWLFRGTFLLNNLASSQSGNPKKAMDTFGKFVLPKDRNPQSLIDENDEYCLHWWVSSLICDNGCKNSACIEDVNGNIEGSRKNLPKVVAKFGGCGGNGFIGDATRRWRMW